MPVCDWCHTPLRGLSNTGRPRPATPPPLLRHPLPSRRLPRPRSAPHVRPTVATTRTRRRLATTNLLNITQHNKVLLVPGQGNATSSGASPDLSTEVRCVG